MVYPGVKYPPPTPVNAHICFHFYVIIKGLRRAWLFEVSESPSRGYWKQFLLSRPYEHCQILPAAEGGTLPQGKVSPCPLNPHVCFHFYVMIKGLRKTWLFEVSESPSRGYWKQFLLFRPYEHNQYLPVVEGDNLPQGKVSPHPQPSCMLSFLCSDKRDWEEPGYLKFLKALQADTGNNSHILSLWTQSKFSCSRGGHSTPG